MRSVTPFMIAVGWLALGAIAHSQTPTPANPDFNRTAPWTATAPTNPAGNPLPSNAAPLPTAAPRRDPAVQPATHVEAAPALALTPAGKPKSFGEHGASALPGVFTMLLSLGFVLALFFLMTWMFRRGLPKGALALPTEVVEVLGRAAVAQRQYVHLIKIGNKLLLVSATPGGMDALTEITDPVEVDRLLGQCRAQQPHSVTSTFKQLLQQFSGEKPAQAARAGEAEHA